MGRVVPSEGHGVTAWLEDAIFSLCLFMIIVALGVSQCPNFPVFIRAPFMGLGYTLMSSFKLDYLDKGPRGLGF
jgi:hypothetical protein